MNPLAMVLETRSRNWGQQALPSLSVTKETNDRASSCRQILHVSHDSKREFCQLQQAGRKRMHLSCQDVSWLLNLGTGELQTPCQKDEPAGDYGATPGFVGKLKAGEVGRCVGVK